MSFRRQWQSLLGKLSKKEALRPSCIAEDIRTVERQLGIVMPEPLRAMYLTMDTNRLGLLPLVTGREGQDFLESTSNSGEALQASLEANGSVLGWALANAGTVDADDHFWPRGLLLVEDYGCAIYHAVDLTDANLRIVRYEWLDPSETPESEETEQLFAYPEPLVPRRFRGRFVVESNTLAEWIRSLETRAELTHVLRPTAS